MGKIHKERLQHFGWKLGGREWRYEHVHIQICMEDGVCVGVNVVEGIGSGALPRHKRYNKYLQPLRNSFYTCTWSAVSFTHSMKVATSAANTGSTETVKWEMENKKWRIGK